MTSEASYTCVSCGEEIVIPIDYSAGTSQEFVEDCPVCCRANVIHRLSSRSHVHQSACQSVFGVSHSIMRPSSSSETRASQGARYGF